MDWRIGGLMHWLIDGMMGWWIDGLLDWWLDVLFYDDFVLLDSLIDWLRDSLTFDNDIIISKCVDGSIMRWIPDFSTQGKYLILDIYEFEVHNPFWYSQFTYDKELGVILVGTDHSAVYMFDVNNDCKQNKYNIARFSSIHVWKKSIFGKKKTIMIN